MKRKTFLRMLSGTGALGLTPSTLQAAASTSRFYRDKKNDRTYWTKLLCKIASPVLSHMSEGKLKEQMPVETPSDSYGGREKVTHLEALGRTMAGVAPWLTLPETADEESRLRKDLKEKALKSIEIGRASCRERGKSRGVGGGEKRKRK